MRISQNLIPLVFLTRRESFSAAHKLFREDWSEEENSKIFGKCANPNWHGHNYILFVTVKGIPDPVTGLVSDLSAISEVVRRKVIKRVDHKNLNLDVDFMKGKMPSTEVLAIAFWEELETEIRSLGCLLHCIKIQETENNSVEYYGE